MVSRGKEQYQPVDSDEGCGPIVLNIWKQNSDKLMNWQLLGILFNLLTDRMTQTNYLMENVWNSYILKRLSK